MTTRKKAPLIIPAELDDDMLSQSEFRVLCHIARRCGAHGACWENAEAMRKICRMEVKTLRYALHMLVLAEWVIEEKRPGLTSIYRIHPKRR
jgi:hypothetical protein